MNAPSIAPSLLPASSSNQLSNFFALDFGRRQSANNQSRIAPPSSFLDYLTRASIESDDGEGVIPFELFPYQHEIAERWDAGESMVVLKRRQVGLSWLAAHFCLFTASFRTGHNAVLSAGQREADEFMRKVAFAWRHLPADWQVPYTGIAPMKLANGNIVQSLPSTENAGISFTFARMFCDEAAAHPYGAPNYGQYRAAIANGQYLCFSASNPKLGPSGFFYDMWQRAVAGDVPYSPVFVGRDVRPDQGREWMETERRAYSGQPETFDALYPESPEMAFVGRSGLVYPEFTTQLHTRTDHPMAWEQYTYRFAGIDPGGGDPTAIVPMGVWIDAKRGQICYHQPHEFYSRKPVTIDAIAGYLALFHNRAPFDRIWLDTAGGTTLLASLQALGYPVVAADKNRDGMIAVRQTIAENRLTIHTGCKDSIAEFAGYRLAERRDPNSHEKFATSTPVDNHADAHDARRYVIRSVEQLLRRNEVRKAVNGATIVQPATNVRRAG